MSGGGPGPSFSSNKVEESCEDLKINISLASPVSAVVAKLVVNDLLDIVAVTKGGPLQVLTSAGELAGSILSGNQKRLLKCINQGTEYIAEVVEINEGLIKVKIYHA